MECVRKRAVAAVIPVLILFFVCFAAGAVFADGKKTASSGVPKDAPHIEFKQPAHDFGEVMQDAKPEHTFIFNSNGFLPEFGG